MERVRVISSNTILPATYTPDSTRQKIHLAPWDLQLLLVSSIQKGLLFTNSPPNLIHLLTSSLSRTLDYFYPLAGRLAFSEDVGKDAKLYYVDCNNDGVEFVQAVAEDVTVGEILKSEYDVGVIHRLFSMNGLVNIECDVKPFLAVQVTRFGDGGCFVGCTLSHLFADGSSFWHFFNSWSEICRRGSSLFSISNAPVLERQYPYRKEVWFPNKNLVRRQVRRSQSVLRERMFHFSKEKIIALKQKAVGESGNQKISSLQGVLAHVWRGVVRSRGVDPNTDVQFTMAIGDRTRTEPALPTHYLGNVTRLVKATLKGEEVLAERSLGQVACQLNKLIASQTSSVAMDFISSWLENPSVINLGTLVTTNYIVTSNSPRFDVYGNDFGWGRPVAVRSGGASKGDGKLTLFVGLEDGSMDVEVCLVAETLEVLEKDGEFMDGVY
ncbi:hypothetical protein QQ045_005527 [Rhodiola kirilowii]